MWFFQTFNLHATMALPLLLDFGRQSRCGKVRRYLTTADLFCVDAARPLKFSFTA